MATFEVLTEGYIREGDDLRVASTVSFVRDGAALIVIDPGMVSSVSQILDPLRDLGIEPEAITDVVFSHHHPDHTINAALFANARIHDYWATYEADLWIDREAEGFQVSPDVTLLQTPGHTREDVTTLVTTEGGVVAFTHLWWMAEGPADDPYTIDREVHRAQRERVLERAALIVPGHGPAFAPDGATAR